MIKSWIAGSGALPTKGELFGIHPTENHVTLTGIDILRIADGKVVEIWRQEDIIGMMQQLDAIPC